MPAELHFLRPLWFLALGPLLALLFVLWRRRARDQAWRGLVDAHLLPHLLVGTDGEPRRLPLALLGLGWLLAVTALAGPVWERLPQPVFATTAERVILLDLSPSMNAADVRPSRLARARFELLDLLRATKEGQVALIAFGPEPFLVSPLTGDAQTIAAQVPQLATDLIPVPGPRRTDRALEMAGELLAQAGAVGGEVILISDGIGDGASGVVAGDPPAVAAARSLAESGVRVSVLGVGTPQGAPIPAAKGGFADDPSGAIRMARPDRRGLEAVAAAGQGRYVSLDAGDRDTLALTDDGALQAGKVVEQEGLAADQWREEGPWLLLALLPVAALGFRRGWLLPILALVVLLPPESSWALGWDDLWQRPDQRAARAFASGDAAGAAAGFADPSWRAAARYRAADYAEALDDLAGLSGPEADYNRGNALARLGRLDEAIAAYERTLDQVPDHEDAKANLDLVRQLKDRQEPPPQQSQDPEQSQSGSDGGQGQSQAVDGSEAGDSSREAGEQPQGGQEHQENQGAGESESGEPGAGSEEAGQSQASPGEPGADQAGSGQSGEAQAGQPGEAGAARASEAPQGPGKEPDAGDLGQSALGGEQEVELPPDQGAADRAEADSDGRTDRAQSGQGNPTGEGQPGAQGVGAQDLTPEQREQIQAMDAQLRRVPDDPAGLLRQRFLLQHLRREGRLQ